MIAGTLVKTSSEEEGRALEGWAIRRVVYEVGQDWRGTERRRFAELEMSRNIPAAGPGITQMESGGPRPWRTGPRSGSVR